MKTPTATASKSSLIVARDLLVTLANRTGGYPGIGGEIAALTRKIARS